MRLRVFVRRGSYGKVKKETVIRAGFWSRFF